MPRAAEVDLKTDTKPAKEGDVVIIGGGLAGLSAAIYLGRARRETIIVDAGKSMAVWEPHVQNYLGFPKGIDGTELVAKGLKQARRYGARYVRDYIKSAERVEGGFLLRGKRCSFKAGRVLLATGIYHIPPDIPGVNPCLGHSMFFCKDCDGFRIKRKPVAVYGWNNGAVEYALGMLSYTPYVALVTDGRASAWDKQHDKWIAEYQIPVYRQTISKIRRRGNHLRGLVFDNHKEIAVKALFTVRGDIYYNEIARDLGAKINKAGEILTDNECRTSVPGLYAAGCVTPANCQMIVAAGQGAVAAQAINRDLFEHSLSTHSLRRVRKEQVEARRVRPRVRQLKNLPEQHDIDLQKTAPATTGKQAK